MPTTYQALVTDLNAQSFHKVPLTCTRQQIEEAVEAFFKFMDLPEEVKREYSF